LNGDITGKTGSEPAAGGAARDPEEQRRLKEELGRITFGE